MSSTSRTEKTTNANGAPERLDRPLLVLALTLVSGAVLALVNTTMVGVALPDIGADLGADLGATSWVGTGFVLALAVAIPVSGWSVVRYGVRRTWLVAMALFGLGSLASALAPGLGVLVTARIGQGLGAGMLEPLMLTAVAQAAGPARMGRAMGLVAGAIGVGPLLGPVLGGAVVSQWGWRWLFACFVPLALAHLLLSARVLPRDDGTPRRLDVVGLALLAVGTGAVLSGLSEAAGPRGLGASATVSILLGVVVLAGYVAWARSRGPAAVADLAPFVVPGFAPAAVVMLLLGAAIYPVFYGLPQFFQGAVGTGVLASGLLLVPHGFGALTGMSVGGRLSDTVRPRTLALAGAVVATAGSAAYVLAGADAPLPVYVVASLVTGAGTGFVGGPTVSSLYRSLDPELVPAGSTLLFVLNQVGGALGIAVMTVLIGAAGWTAATGAWPMLLPAVGSLAIAGLALRLR